MSVISARLYIALMAPPWVTREYTAFAIWSLPLGVFVVVASVLLRRLLTRSGRTTRAIVGLIAGIMAAVAYIYAAFYATGGYVMAFDFPLLYCWGAGAVAGFLVALFWKSAASAASPA
jgi:hypothetical protein